MGKILISEQQLERLQKSTNEWSYLEKAAETQATSVETKDIYLMYYKVVMVLTTIQEVNQELFQVTKQN